MSINEDLTGRIKQITAANITDDAFKKLAEYAFLTLTNEEEQPNISSLYNSKPDVIKFVYATLLAASAEFGRNCFDKEAVRTFLTSKCGFSQSRADFFADLYGQNELELKTVLSNIGSHLPHLVDAKWKIDYIIKSSNLDQADGPIFRVCLVAHRYDEAAECAKSEQIRFSCNSQELQDLVYKLKDAVRHCQRLTVDH